MGLWWNWYAHLFKGQAPKGLRVRISPGPFYPSVAQLAEAVDLESIQWKFESSQRDLALMPLRETALPSVAVVKAACKKR